MFIKLLIPMILICQLAFADNVIGSGTIGSGTIGIPHIEASAGITVIDTGTNSQASDATTLAITNIETNGTDNRVILYFGSQEDSDATAREISGVAWNSESFARVTDGDFEDNPTEIDVWCLDNPSSSTSSTVTATYTGNVAESHGYAFVATGITDCSLDVAIVENFTTSGNPSDDITTSSADTIIFDIVGKKQFTGTITSSGQPDFWIITEGGNHDSGSSYRIVSSADTYTFTWTLSDTSEDTLHSIIALTGA